MNLFVALKTGVLNKSPGWRMTRKGTKLAEIIISCKKDGIQFNEQMFLDVLDLLKFNPAQRERKSQELSPLKQTCFNR